MTHYMGGSTWLEGWQGVAADGCGAPVAPHDGMPSSNYTYTYDATAGTLTVNGVGAHIGLPKAYNGGELTSSAGAPASITYLITFTNGGNSMTADIEIAGGGFWRFDDLQ